MISAVSISKELQTVVVADLQINTMSILERDVRRICFYLAAAIHGGVEALRQLGPLGDNGFSP